MWIGAQLSNRGDRALTPEDRFEILDLISSYSWGYDTADWELQGSLWADDAQFEGANGDRRIGAEITLGSRQRREGLAKRNIQTRHFQTNTLFEVIDADRVRARTIFHVMWQHAGTDPPVPMHTGEYHDEFVRTANGWKFARRRATIDHD